MSVHVQRSMELTALVRDTQRTLRRFSKQRPDWKRYESAMVKEAKRSPALFNACPFCTHPKESDLDYLERLYQKVSSRR